MEKKWWTYILLFVFIYNDFRDIFISGKYLVKYTADALK